MVSSTTELLNFVWTSYFERRLLILSALVSLLIVLGKRIHPTISAILHALISGAFFALALEAYKLVGKPDPTITAKPVKEGDKMTLEEREAVVREQLRVDSRDTNLFRAGTYVFIGLWTGWLGWEVHRQPALGI